RELPSSAPQAPRRNVHVAPPPPPQPQQKSSKTRVGGMLAQLNERLTGERAGADPDQEITIHLTEELSLQESLDRLGYTVNVPAESGHRPLHQWNRNYRVSTRSDAVPEGWFHSSGGNTYRVLGQQGMLARHTAFGLARSDGNRHDLLAPAGSGQGMWLSTSIGKTASETFSGRVRLYTDVKDPYDSFGSGVYFTTESDNPERSTRVLVLPALTGGEWVDEGNNTGHWQGGESDGAYLFCWEDWTDHDFQDVIVRARGIVPAGR
ncbi:MAG: hypothetical protein KY468_15480, partial [Armatimonadetes bacterium]|nr:hypothetical protein [Armatimonadota bacterium]